MSLGSIVAQPGRPIEPLIFLRARKAGLSAARVLYHGALYMQTHLNAQ